MDSFFLLPSPPPRLLCVSCSLIETWDLKICVFFMLCYGEIKLNSMVLVALIRLHGFMSYFLSHPSFHEVFRPQFQIKTWKTISCKSKITFDCSKSTWKFDFSWIFQLQTRKKVAWILFCFPDGKICFWILFLKNWKCLF